MKKLTAILLALVLALGTACAFADDDYDDYDDDDRYDFGGPRLGGWTAAEDPALTPELQAVFEKGMEGLLGMNYVPVLVPGIPGGGRDEPRVPVPGEGGGAECPADLEGRVPVPGPAGQCQRPGY